jgi:hypothetical protein
LGYSETLTQKALLKVGLAAAQNELLDELIRLQHIRAVDPKVPIVNFFFNFWLGESVMAIILAKSKKYAISRVLPLLLYNFPLMKI